MYNDPNAYHRLCLHNENQKITGALYSKELFYVVHLRSSFHSWFLDDLYHFACCTCVYTLTVCLVFVLPCHAWV